MSSGTKPSQNLHKKPETSSKEPKGKVGEWVRHISSSGKDYYFNITTHESHWEKPREWVEFEHRHGPVSYHPGQAQSSVTPNKTLVKSTSQPIAVANVNTKDQLPHPASSSLSHNSHNAPQLTSTTQPEPTTPTPQRTLIRPLLDIAVTLSQIPQTKPTAAFSSHQNGRIGQIEPLFKDRPPPFPSYYSRPSTSAAAGSSQGYGSSNFNGYNGNDRSTTSHHSQYASSSHRQEYGNNSCVKGYGHGRSYHRTPYSSRPRSRHSSSDRGRDSKKPVVEEPQSDDMDISPYENEDSGTDTSTKPGERSLEVASTSGSSPNMPSSARDSRNYRDRDRDRERNRNQTRGRNNHLYNINTRSNGTYSRDRYKGRDRDRDRGSYAPRRGRDRGGDRKRDWRPDSQRDQVGVGVRRSRWGWRDSDQNRDRGGRESDKPVSTYMDTSEDKQEQPMNSSNGRATPEMDQSGAAGVAEPTTHTNSNSHTTAVTKDGTPKEFVVPELPPGLAMYMREDLIAEVNKAMDDPYERDADKMVGKIFESQVQLTGISAELKMARSLVRLSDIQSTLKEQRILFIRSQIESLEEDGTTYTDGLNLGNE